MDDIFKLLNINKNILQDLPRQAAMVVDHRTDMSIQHSIRKLHEIEEKSSNEGTLAVAPQSIDAVIKKVKQYAAGEKHHFGAFTLPEVRIVSYYMMMLSDNAVAYQYAIKLMRHFWRDLFLSGLTFHYLESWGSLDPALQSLLGSLIQEKLRAYDGVNKRYMTLKNHADLFDKQGPKRLSAILKSKKLPLEDAPQFFGNKPSSLYQPYYSEVIVQYFRTCTDVDLDYAQEIFDIHQVDRTRKLVVCAIVTIASLKGKEDLKLSVAKFANRHLGDVTLSASWAPFPGATEEEKTRLEKARHDVVMWLNKQVIQEFFEVCVQDRARKEFWTDYIEYISDFRIIGSDAVRKMLLSDSRASIYIGKHFRVTDQRQSMTAALVLYMGDRCFVEFSDTGALYVYRLEHDVVRKVIKSARTIASISQLKEPEMLNLVEKFDYYYSYNDEGRMIHSGYWQERLSNWIGKQLDIRPKKTKYYSNNSYSYL